MKKNIPDDVWFEIFLHLSLTAIFKFRCISKVWFSILSNPNFINKWYKFNICSLPWGLVHFDRSRVDKNLQRRFSIAYPDSNSQYISDHQHGFSFGFLYPDILDKKTDLQLLGSSKGLVLYTTSLSDHQSYYVCNPLTKKWGSLPPPPRIYKQVLIGFICNECFSSSLVSTSYKVIRIPKIEAAAKEFKVEVYSSDLGIWNVYNVSCPPDVTVKFSCDDNVVTHNGILYWLQKGCRHILAVSVDGNTSNETCGNECKSINLPEPDQAMYSVFNLRRQCLGLSEGLICYAIIKERERSLSVWVLEDNWYLLHKDNEFYGVIAEMKSLSTDGIGMFELIKHIQVLGFNPFVKDVVILGYDKDIWAYNTRTKEYEQLSHPSFLGSSFSVPLLKAFTFPLEPRPTILPPVS